MRSLALLMLLAAPATLRAEFLKIEITFGGMECASCTDFLENKFTRNRNVKSVQIDRQKGILTLELKPENKVRFEDIRDQVQQSGFTPKQSRVTVSGIIQDDGTLQIPEIGQAWKLSGDRPAAGKRVTVHGIAKPGPLIELEP